MDIQSLSSLFATTYNPDPNVRKAGELQIRKVSSPSQPLYPLLNVVGLSQIGGQEGVLTGIIQVIANDSVDKYVLYAYHASF